LQPYLHGLSQPHPAHFRAQPASPRSPQARSGSHGPLSENRFVLETQSFHLPATVPSPLSCTSLPLRPTPVDFRQFVLLSDQPAPDIPALLHIPLCITPR